MADRQDLISKPQIRAALLVAMIDGADKGVVAKIADLLGLLDEDDKT